MAKKITVFAALFFSALLLFSSCGKQETGPVPSERESSDSGIEIISETSGGVGTELQSEQGTEYFHTSDTEKITEALTEKETEKETEPLTEKQTEHESETKPVPTAYVPETQKYDHYHNNINAYYSGNVLVCGDYAVEYFSSNRNGNSSYAEAVNKFVAKYPDLNVTALLTPKACAFISPEGYSNTYESQKAFIDATYDMLDSSVKRAKCAELLAEHDGEYLFYRTDHHWTSLGAYYASVAYCEANGINSIPLDEYETVVGGDYIGSLYGYCAEPKPSSLLKNPDHSVAHIPKTGCTMTYISGGTEYNGKLINTASSSYAGMFICGDQPLTHIVTDNKNGKKLLIFKESYGNAYVPYMVDYYEEVVAVDFRKDTASVEKIIADYGITDVLMINNVQSAVSLAQGFARKLAS